MRKTVQEIIKILSEYDPNEELLITWWGEGDDFAELVDKDQAFNLAEEALPNCIGHINDYVNSQYQGAVW